VQIAGGVVDFCEECAGGGAVEFAEGVSNHRNLQSNKDVEVVPGGEQGGGHQRAGVEGDPGLRVVVQQIAQ
jgi:hypothetical protein